MPRATYIVGGVAYGSNTALKRAWSKLAPQLKAPVHPQLSPEEDGEKVYLEGDVRKWYIEAAFVTSYRRDQLKWTNLDSALVNTKVYVARGDWHNGNSKSSKVRCIFFENPLGHSRIISSSPVDKKLDYRACINSKLRESISDQIKRFRAINQHMADGKIDGKSKRLRCAICHRCINGESHVDHGTGKFSFNSIASAFISTIVPKGSLSLYGPEVARIIDKHIPDWQKYHHKHARLKLTHSACNLTNK